MSKDARGQFLGGRKEAGLLHPCRQVKRCRNRNGNFCYALEGETVTSPRRGIRNVAKQRALFELLNKERVTKLRADSEMLSQEYSDGHTSWGRLEAPSN